MEVELSKEQRIRLTNTHSFYALDNRIGILFNMGITMFMGAIILGYLHEQTRFWYYFGITLLMILIIGISLNKMLNKLKKLSDDNKEIRQELGIE